MKFLEYLLLERNIVNSREVEDLVESFHAIRADIKKWLKSNLKNYILRDYDDFLDFDPHRDHRYLDAKKKTDPWIEKAIDRGEKLFLVRISTALENQIYHVLDYFRANPNLNISRISVPEAIRQSEQWTERLNKKASDQEDVAGTETVRKYPDGFRWVKVTSKQALDREGKLMRHCVGSYCSQVSSGSTSIYSLRDKKNEPHCTIELKSGSINQIKGKANGPIDSKYIKYVKDFVLKPISGEKYAKVSDLKNLGLIEIENKIYDINNLPTGLKVGGDLDLGGCTSLTNLSSGLKVQGTLYLYGCTSLKALPSGLKVGGYLDLSGCTSLKALPTGLKVGGSLSLWGCTSLTNLPSGLKVGGHLYLRNCTSLKALPSGLKVGGYLYLRNCTSLTNLPEDLEVKGTIYISDSMMKYFEDSKFKDQIR